MRDYLNHVYYNWVLVDVILNSFGSMAYLIQLERVAFEQKESSESFIKLTDKEGPEKSKRAPKKLAIGADYYALSFCSMMKHYRQKAGVSQE